MRRRITSIISMLAIVSAMLFGQALPANAEEKSAFRWMDRI